MPDTRLLSLLDDPLTYQPRQHAPFLTRTAQMFGTGGKQVAQLAVAPFAAAELGVRKLFGADLPQPGAPDERGAWTPLKRFYELQDIVREGQEAVQSYDPRTGAAGLAEQVAGTTAQALPMVATTLLSAGAAAPAAVGVSAPSLAATFSGLGTYGQELVEGSSVPTALGQGVIEAGATFLGGRTGTEALLGGGRVARSLPGAIARGGAAEYLEEGGTSVAQDLARAFTDQTDIPALGDLFERANVAGLSGFALGAPAAGVAAAPPRPAIRIDASTGAVELPAAARASQEQAADQALFERAAEQERIASVQDPGPAPDVAGEQAAELADVLQGPGRQVAPLNPVDVEAQAAQALLAEQAAAPERQAARVAEDQARADAYVLREDLDAYRRAQATGEAPVGHEIRGGQIIADPTIRNRVYDLGEAQAQAIVDALPPADLLDPTLTSGAYEGRLAQLGTPEESAATEPGVRRGPRPEEIAALETPEARIAAIAEHPEAARPVIRQQVAKIRAARPRPVQEVGPQPTPIPPPAPAGVPDDRQSRQPIPGQRPQRQADAGVAPVRGRSTQAAPSDRGQQVAARQEVAPAAPDVPLTVDTLRAQLTDAYSKTSLPKERQAEVVETAHDLLQAAAKAAGETPDAFIAKRIRRIEGAPGASAKQQGSAAFLVDGRAIIRIMQSGNEETIGHELFHVFRRYLKPSDLAAAERELNVDPKKGWTRANEEAFVKAAMRWKAKGEPPTAPLAATFAKFKQWFADLYDSFKGRGGKTSPALEKVFRDIFTPGKGLQAEYRPTGGEITEAAAAPAPMAPAKAVPAPAAPVAPVAPAAEIIPEPKTVDAEIMPEEAAEPAVPAKPVTGIKNEISTADRQRLGLPERDTVDGRSFDEMYDAGKTAKAKDPQAATKLVDALRLNPEMVVSSNEEAGLLLLRKVELENELQALLRQADAAREAKDANGLLIAQAQLDTQRVAIKEFTELVERAGTAAGRALVARKMMSDMDYSLSHMEYIAEAAKGAKLTGPELNKVRTLYQTVSEKMQAAKQSTNLRTQTELAEAKRLWDAEVQRYERAKRTTGEKILDAIKEAPGFTKSLKASLDLSALFRQGWRVMFTNPVIWQRNARTMFADAWKTFGGKEVMDAVNAEMQLNPYFDAARAGGLAIGVTEEAFPSSVLERVPGFGRAYKAAQDAFTGFQYRNRMHIFEKLMNVAKRSGIDVTDAKQIRSIAQLVNSMTSRGSLGPAERAGDVVNTLFFSGRKLMADVDFLTAHAFRKDFGGFNPANLSFARQQALWNLVKVIGGVAAILAIANSVDDEAVEFDPRSSDFGKIKVRNTRFDVSGGASPITTLAARIASGATKSSTTGKIHPIGELDKRGLPKFGSRTKADVALDFFRNKLSPAAGTVAAYFRGQRGNFEPFTALGAAEDLLLPMAIGNFVELLQDEKATPELIVAGTIADFLGIGTNTYSGKPKR